MKKILTIAMSGLLLFSTGSAVFADTNNALSKEDTIKKVIELRVENINDRVTDGELTQEQADKLLEKLNNMDFTKLKGRMGNMKGKIGNGRMMMGNKMLDVHYEILADLTDKTVDELKDMNNENGRPVSLRKIASDEGVLEEFSKQVKEKHYEIKLDSLKEGLDNGKITEEQYNDIMERIETSKALGEMFKDIRGSMRDTHLEIIADLTDKSLSEIEDLAKDPKELRDFVKDNDIAEELRNAVHEKYEAVKLEILEEKLADGSISQEEYDKYVDLIKNKPQQKPNRMMIKKDALKIRSSQNM